MAIKYDKLIEQKKGEDVAPLTTEELGYIAEVEAFIDAEITNKINTDKKEVWIDMLYTNFNRRIKGSYPPMTYGRKKFLKEELFRRYREAGWSFGEHIDDGLDGPNMSGSDYTILKGKKN